MHGDIPQSFSTTQKGAVSPGGKDPFLDQRLIALLVESSRPVLSRPLVAPSGSVCSLKFPKLQSSLRAICHL